MGAPVNTVASGGIAVIDVTATTPKFGAPVSEALPGKGTAVTKVTNYGVPVTFDGLPVVYDTINPADIANVLLSNGNLTVTGKTGTGGARGAVSFSSGKYYFESKLTAIINNSVAAGVCTLGANLTTINTNTTGAAAFTRLGPIWINNANSGVSIGTRAVNDVIGIAVDITARLIWFRVSPAGIWNNSGTADPAAGVGGINISALSGALYVLVSTGTTANDAITVNFGASAFTGAVPSGFTSGWPA
jgi:hypothetical protein